MVFKLRNNSVINSTLMGSFRYYSFARSIINFFSYFFPFLKKSTLVQNNAFRPRGSFFELPNDPKNLRKGNRIILYYKYKERYVYSTRCLDVLKLRVLIMKILFFLSFFPLVYLKSLLFFPSSFFCSLLIIIFDLIIVVSLLNLSFLFLVFSNNHSAKFNNA